MTNMEFNHYDAAAKDIVDHVGKKIVIGLPLGLGKPVGLINSLYRLACEDNSIQLTIITALTLARPDIKNELQKRLAAPILERIIKDYEDPLFEKDRANQTVPSNIRIIEFFLNPAKYLDNAYVQQNYISSAYTLVIRDALNLSINVLAQLITTSPDYPGKFSVSCNSDLFADMSRALRNLEKQGRKIAIVGEVNNNLPFMPNDAIAERAAFTHIVDTGKYKALFALPRDEISASDHMIGLYTSSLIKDNGCLQVGIGSLSNALANALIMRQNANDLYQQTLLDLGVKHKFGDSVTELVSLTPFTQGLYASTELLSDEYLHLYQNNILKKRVYDHIGLQSLLNENKINDVFQSDILDILLAHDVIKVQLTRECVDFLKSFGIFKEEVVYLDGNLIINNEKIPAIFDDNNKQKIIVTCLGTELKNGKIVHAGFILGSTFLYDALKDIPKKERELFNMTSVSRTNRLTWQPELLNLQRIYGRFVNSAMMVTITGAVISDGLDNIQEVSGVGGQFDFVDMAQYLPDARSIINCHSTRQTKHGAESNIRWNYPNNTIPRYLRDIVITEYGIADCRSKTDADVIKAMLNITDSRFQNELLAVAKRNNKLEKDYEIPFEFRENYPQRIKALVKNLQAKNYCLRYPFGSELTEDELVIKKALTSLKFYNRYQLFILLIKSLFFMKSDASFEVYLKRMQVYKPLNLTEWVYKKILKYAIDRVLD